MKVGECLMDNTVSLSCVSVLAASEHKKSQSVINCLFLLTVKDSHSQQSVTLAATHHPGKLGWWSPWQPPPLCTSRRRGRCSRWWKLSVQQPKNNYFHHQFLLSNSFVHEWNIPVTFLCSLCSSHWFEKWAGTGFKNTSGNQWGISNIN